MNLILLENDSPCQTLDAEDRRTRHILDVLMRDGKNSFFVGLRDGRMGKASPFELPDGALQLRVDWSLPEADTLAPVEMIIGLPRPQSARRILRDLPTMGIRKACFFVGGKGESGYATSSLWKTDEWTAQLREGVEQSFNPRFPDVSMADSLETALSKVCSTFCRIALDLYEAEQPYMQALVQGGAACGVTLAIGPERGWNSNERGLLRSAGFVMCSMGARVMRSDTAVIAAASVWNALNPKS